jgi:hypothetical protein
MNLNSLELEVLRLLNQGEYAPLYGDGPEVKSLLNKGMFKILITEAGKDVLIKEGPEPSGGFFGTSGSSAT